LLGIDPGIERWRMRVGIGADHGGFVMKEQLARKLAEEGHEVVDFGNMVHDPNDDYPDFAIPLARAVARGNVERGILLCGSGVGALGSCQQGEWRPCGALP
jgi:ribose 5-phosphate isomerase B